MLLDIFKLNDETAVIPITCKTDNNGMYDSAHSTTQILNKRLRIEMAILREMLQQQEILQMVWVSKDKQIADGLTKKGVVSLTLLQYLTGVKGPAV